jgi:hypothetical protein
VTVTTRGVRLRRVLMVGQVAVGCALLAGAGFLTRTIAALERQPLGYDARAIAFVEYEPAKSGLDGAEQLAFLAEVRQQAATGRPIAAADFAPFGGTDSRIVFAVGSPVDRAVAVPSVRVAGPYFELLGIPRLAGATFEPRTGRDRVAVLSQPLAEWFWPGQSAIGKALRFGGPDGPSYTIIGVVGGVRDAGLRGAATGRLYLPIDGLDGSLTLITRAPAPDRAAVALADEVRAAHPRLVPVRSGALTDLVARSLDQRVMFRFLTATVGAGALFVVAAGVWGLALGTIARRWREFGVRLALGADPRSIARLAMRDAAIVLGVGGAVGLAGAWLFGRVLESWLFGVTPADPATLAGAWLLVAAAVVLGNGWPARRASRIDPAELLRRDHAHV